VALDRRGLGRLSSPPESPLQRFSIRPADAAIAAATGCIVAPVGLAGAFSASNRYDAMAHHLPRVYWA
jgi:hypothetical protein